MTQRSILSTKQRFQVRDAIRALGMVDDNGKMDRPTADVAKRLSDVLGFTVSKGNAHSIIVDSDWKEDVPDTTRGQFGYRVKRLEDAFDRLHPGRVVGRRWAERPRNDRLRGTRRSVGGSL